MGVVVSVCVWVCDCFDFFQFGYGYVVVSIWVWVCYCFDLFQFEYGCVVVFDLGVVMWFFLWFVVNGGVVGG